MRIALIATGDAAEESAEGPVEAGVLAGRSLVQHQLDFALALGCEKVILFDPRASEGGLELRREVEAADAQFQIVRGVRDLPATVRGDDQLLVLAHGLLPDSTAAFELLKSGFVVLVLPAEAGWRAGFERLDLAATWGGAMVVPGRLVAWLDQLPEDAEPVAGLLRIARQAGVPERPLPERELNEGRWQIVRTAEAAQANELAWLRRRLPSVSPFRPTAWLARAVVRRYGSQWSADVRIVAGFAIGAVVALAGAVAAAWFGLPALAFGLLVPAALATEASDALRLLERSIFVEKTRPSRLSFALHLTWDAVVGIVGVLAISGSRAHRLFAPLVTAGMLHVPPPPPETGWRALAADRGLLAVLLTLATAFGFAEGGFMVIALLLIALRVAVPPGERG